MVLGKLSATDIHSFRFTHESIYEDRCWLPMTTFKCPATLNDSFSLCRTYCACSTAPTGTISIPPLVVIHGHTTDQPSRLLHKFKARYEANMACMAYTVRCKHLCGLKLIAHSQRSESAVKLVWVQTCTQSTSSGMAEASITCCASSGLCAEI